MLNPLGVYINAIELMYRLAQYNWDAHIYEEIRMSVTFYNIWILAAGAPSDRLQVSHIVIALQDCIIAMARLTGFFRLSALISLDGEMIGHLEFGNNQSPSDNNTSVSLQEDSSLLVNNNRSDGSSINSGHIVDPNDHRFVITYDFYEKAIDSKEIFTVVLDGLATSAQFEPNEYCDVLEVHSMSGTVAISITKILGEPTLVRYYDLTRSLLIIVTGVIVRQRMFRELGFSISYNGLEIAEGYLFKVTLANNGTQERPQLQKRR